MNYRANTLIWLCLAHVFVISLSNVLVQYPFVLFGFHSTWGALSYPFIFILTDLTTRLHGSEKAKKIIYLAMLPGLLCSYFISIYYSQGVHTFFNLFALRIALSSFSAYVLGQYLDIIIFQRLRQQAQWWVAPSISNTLGNLFDTYFFFFIAFYQSSNAFLSTHWLEIASLDLVFKQSISLLAFIPFYGLFLRILFAKKAAHFMQELRN